MADFAGGNGSALSPYLIATWEHLNAMRTQPGANFLLLNNIDCEGRNWLPAGPAAGVIDGGGHVLSNFVSVRDTGGVGLIDSIVSGASLTIRRLGIIGEDRAAVRSVSAYYGGYFVTACGTGRNLLIEDCFAYGPIGHGGDRGSGMVGIVEGSATVRRVWSDTLLWGATPTRGMPVIWRYAGTVTLQGGVYYSDRYPKVGGDTSVRYNASQYTQQANFPDWDFESVWQMTAAGPRLRPTGVLRTRGGNVTREMGGPADLVAIHGWADKRLVATATPDSNGDWSVQLPDGEYGISYFAAGLQPVVHGPYTVAPD